MKNGNVAAADVGLLRVCGVFCRSWAWKPEENLCRRRRYLGVAAAGGISPVPSFGALYWSESKRACFGDKVCFNISGVPAAAHLAGACWLSHSLLSIAPTYSTYISLLTLPRALLLPVACVLVLSPVCYPQDELLAWRTYPLLFYLITSWQRKHDCWLPRVSQ